MKVLSRKLLSWLLALAVVLSFSFGNLAPLEAKAESSLTTVKPIVAVTGNAVISGGTYSASNVSGETSFTLEELKAIAANDSGAPANNQYLYSTYNTYLTKGTYVGEGIELKTLLEQTGFTAWANTRIQVNMAGDKYETVFDPEKTHIGDTDDAGKKVSQNLGVTRYYYPNLSDDSEAGKQEIETIIAWAADESDDFSQLTENGALKLMTGQIALEDFNKPLFNGNSKTTSFNITAGDALSETALTVGSKTYTRAEVLMMERADNSYTYDPSSGSATDYVRGVPMSVLLAGYDDDDVVTFEAADGYDVAATGYTVKQLIDNDYMMAYEKGNSVSDLAGIYDANKTNASQYGFFRLYGSDEKGKPAKMVNKITVTSASGIDYSTSPYKHITNGGQSGSGPYNIDSITGATLTVEGPGVKSSVPVSVRDLEGRNAGAARAVYTDTRRDHPVERTYEGIDLYYILHSMSSGDNGIKLTDGAQGVLIKNRTRNTIASFTLDQVEEAHNSGTPIMVAYGTAYKDGTNVRPFVFDGGSGADSDLGNEDGCIKLVYDKASITGDTNTNYNTFGNMAYIYVTEGDAPGYKHDKEPYQSADISNYVLTVTGDKIGREVNYTVAQLENMVGYDSEGKPDNSGMGYRDEYSLANSNYWYVNEYEGVQLWKLLLRSGLDPALASDDSTIVSSTATDGYAATDKFTTRQVADPDSFGYYEKNPLDLNDGTYEGNENIRQGDDVSTGDKLRTGFPVLVAYGVNGYPYVEKNSQDGYISGLQNDGGPLRIISGKLKYNHANGSNQAKFLDKVIVGDNTNHYSTHKYHTDSVYTDMAENSSLEVKILNGADADAPELKSAEYKVGDIEELIYGGKLTKTQLDEAKIKTFYQLTKGSSAYSDLYEGIDLNYFLKNVVELPGYKGTITFSNGTDSLTLSLEDVLAAKNGSNTETGMTGLAPVLAYGKNGAPMVTDKNADGYQNKITLAAGTDYENQITVKNDGGPLAVLFPHTDSSVSDKSLTNITSITVNLSADKYAHTKAPYDTYKDEIVTIGGEGTKLTSPKDFTVSELEGKQTIAFTGDYSMLKEGASSATQARYRGINLYSLLTSTAVGLKSNADKVIVNTTDGESQEFTLSEIRKTYTNTVTGEDGLPVILAYGAGKAGDADKEDGLPLVAEKSSDGYDAAYGNNGGPLRLVVGQADADDVNSGKNIKFVSSIMVSASEMDSWNHSSSDIFSQYLSETVNLQVVDKEGTELFNKDYTVGELEANTSLIERITATTTQVNTWEGINFWDFVLKETAGIDGVADPITVDVTAADGFGKELRSIFGLDALENGIKDGEEYRSIILAYGMDGYPLVIGDKTHPNGEGFDATVQNNGGPIRLVTHGNQGASLTYVKKIKVTVGEGTPVGPTADFTIKGLDTGSVSLSVDDIKNLSDNRGLAVKEFTSKKGTDRVKGAFLDDILSDYGVVVESTKATLNATDGYEATETSYKDITLKQIKDQNYFVAYQEWDAEAGAWKDILDTDKTAAATQTKVRIYRNYNEAQGNDPAIDWRNKCTNITGITLELPEVVKFTEYSTSAGVRSTWMDDKGTIWVGTYGGGLYYKEGGSDEFKVINTESTPALETAFTSAVAADKSGGVWVSQNASYTAPGNNRGVAYIKDGEIETYTVESKPDTIPNNYVQAIKVDEDGTVWFGSFGGITKYDPQAGTWQTWSKETSGFPATSVQTIELDGEGGAWLGFYPDGEGTAADPYTGGFCHIDGEGNVSNVTTAVGEMTSDGSTSKLAQAWVRDIAIDPDGGVWAVASGSYANIENEGGTMWYLAPGADTPTRYTGDELVGDYLDGAANSELRVLTFDDSGAMWLGTSADGILKIADPTVKDGKFEVTDQYAKETGSWTANNMNNVYSLAFWNDGTLYAGSAAGVAVLGEEPEKAKEVIGDKDAETAAFTVDGDGAAKLGYFSIKGLKNAEGLVRTDATYSWMNKAGTTGQNTFQGVLLENLLGDVIGLTDDAYSFTVISSDGSEKKFPLSTIYAADKDGNKPMIAWQSDEDPDNNKINPKLVIGQADANDVNKGKWRSDIVELRVDLPTEVEQAQMDAEKELMSYCNPDEYSAVNKEAVLAAQDEAIDAVYAAETVEAVEEALQAGKDAIDQINKKEVVGGETLDSAAFTVIGDGTVRNGCFTIKSLKNADGVVKKDATYHWMNKSGTTGQNSFQGVYLDNLLNDVIGLEDNAYAFTVIAEDGYSKTFPISKIGETDIDGNKPMIAWQSDEDPSNPKINPKLVIGQSDANDKNKSSWVGDLVTISVDLATPEQIEDAKSDAADETLNYVNADDYYDEEAAEISTLWTNVLSSLNDASTIKAINDIVEEFKAAVDQIPNKLQKDKINAIAELESYVDLDDYYQISRNAIVSILADAEDSIEAAETSEEIPAIVSEAKADIDELPTKAEIDDARAEAMTEIDTYYDPADYYEEQKSVLEAIEEDAIDQIMEAETFESIDDIVAEAKAAMDKVQTKEQKDAAEAALEELSTVIVDMKSALGSGSYTEESFAAAEEALDAANALFDEEDVTEAEVKAAKAELIRAWRSLEPVDQAAVQEEKDYYEALDALTMTLIDVYENITPNENIYKPAGFADLQTALDAAEELSESADATASDLRAARSDVLKAVKKLVKKTEMSSEDITVSGMKTVTYNGKARTFTITVKDAAAGTLTEGTDFTVSYTNNKNAGTAKIKVTGIGDNYIGSVTKTFKINKAAQKFTAKPKAKTVKAAKLKKKAQTVTKAITVKKAKGKVTYKKAGGSAKLTISKAGKITVKKGTKKGTYKIKVTVKAAGNKNFKAASKKVTVKIRVK